MKKGTNIIIHNNGRGWILPFMPNQGNIVLAIYTDKQGNKFTHQLVFETKEAANSFYNEFYSLMKWILSFGRDNTCIPDIAFSVEEKWVKINFYSILDGYDDERGAIRFTFDTSKEVKSFLIHYGTAVLGKKVIAFNVEEKWVKINFYSILDGYDDERGAIRFTFDTPEEVKRCLFHYGIEILSNNIIAFYSDEKYAMQFDEKYTIQFLEGT